jgi:CRP-like cAMP-binding protein
LCLFQKKQTIFTQGDPADAVFYIQTGKVSLTVVSADGKEATIAILRDGDFFGEGGLAGQPLRMGSATAMTDCDLLRIEKKAMMEALHREHARSDMFVAYLLARNIRYEEDLVDQLFNSGEKRLARILLLLAHFGKEGIELPRPVHARVMLTLPLETFSAGNTIVVSRGLVEVLPDEASLAMVLSRELAQIALGHNLGSKYAFYDPMLFSDESTYQNLGFRHVPVEETAADEKAIELLKNSPYAQKLNTPGLFLRELAARGPALSASRY